MDTVSTDPLDWLLAIGIGVLAGTVWLVLDRLGWGKWWWED